MKDKKYLKLWISYRDYFSLLSYEQIGKLVMLLIDLADSNAEPDISSMDRDLQILWPVLNREYRFDQEYTARRRANGRKGGLATAERRAASDEHGES